MPLLCYGTTETFKTPTCHRNDECIISNRHMIQSKRTQNKANFNHTYHCAYAKSISTIIYALKIQSYIIRLSEVAHCFRKDSVLCCCASRLQEHGFSSCSTRLQKHGFSFCSIRYRNMGLSFCNIAPVYYTKMHRFRSNEAASYDFPVPRSFRHPAPQYRHRTYSCSSGGRYRRRSFR